MIDVRKRRYRGGDRVLSVPNQRSTRLPTRQPGSLPGEDVGDGGVSALPSADRISVPVDGLPQLFVTNGAFGNKAVAVSQPGARGP